MQVEGQHEVSLLTLMATGARVRNTYRTFPSLRDSPLKGGLIPDGFTLRHRGVNKDFLRRRMAVRPIS